jgi:hypothetical protein
VLLSRVAKPLPSEAAATENVSAHGLRVRTERLWKSGTHLTVHSSEGQHAYGVTSVQQALSNQIGPLACFEEIMTTSHVEPMRNSVR